MPRPSVLEPARSFFHWLQKASLFFGAMGIAPLLLYALFGPADGNPIGLGLWFMFATSVSAMGILIVQLGLALQRSGKRKDR